MRRAHVTFFRLALLAVLFIGRPSLADDADDHFAKGKAAFTASKFEEALREFQAAWSARKTHDLAASMAQAEIQLGKHRDAAEHLAYALRHFPVTAKEDLRKKIESALADVKTRVGTLTVKVNVDGAEVLVDGTPIGRAPLEHDVFVEPGEHKLEARLPKHVTASRGVTAAKGTTQAVELKLSPEPAVTATATASATVTAPPPSPRTMVPAYVLGGVAVAGLAIGGGLLGAYAGKRDEVSALHRSILDAKHSCVAGAPNLDARCNDLESAARTGDSFNHAGIGLMIGAGVVAAGAIAYWLWPQPASTKAGVRVVPIASNAGGGFVAAGNW